MLSITYYNHFQYSCHCNLGTPHLCSGGA